MAGKPFVIAETARLRVTRQLPADVEALATLWTDSDTTKHLGGPRDRAWLVAELEKTARDPYADDWDLWPVRDKADGQVVGHCGLLQKTVNDRAEIEVVYVFSPAVRGRGYAAETARALIRCAFDDRGLERVVALIDPENAASERVAVAAGMRRERDTVRDDGTVRRVYAIEKQR